METHPLPHKKLTEDEIKQFVCDLTVQLHDIKDHLDQTVFDLKNKIELCEDMIHNLKRHFCPEKFQQVMVSGADLSNLLMSTYGNMNMGDPIRMQKPEVEDDTPA